MDVADYPEPAPKPLTVRRIDLAGQLDQVALGDLDAFEAVYDEVAAPTLGVVSRVVRDPAQSEEVTQEVLLEVWQTASRFDARQGSAMAWVLAIAHRRTVDRVRSVTRAAAREARIVDSPPPPDEVAETVEIVLEHQRVRSCLGTLTELQRQSVHPAYYSGYTYGQVADLLHVPIGTVKTRLRDGLIRLRDCLGVQT